MTTHVPVLLDEAVNGLQLTKGAAVIDATIGGGGHAKRILEVIQPTGRLLGIDQDTAAIKGVQDRFAGKTHSELYHGNFREIRQAVSQHSFPLADGVLLDLGFSSDQMGDPSRGLSIQTEGPLDMRLGEGELTAEQIVNHWDQTRLADLLFRFGEERFSRRIARGIVQQRPIRTTTELATIVRMSYPPAARRGRIHPATKTFQALRIAVNDELGALQDFLGEVLPLMKAGGRIAIISFHSLEDRTVKEWMKQQAYEDKLTIVTKKPIVASVGERQQNSRSRSAKLRIAQKNHQL
jgi:16S rRNA (cytosine1402-N4)-methyltransferase